MPQSFKFNLNDVGIPLNNPSIRRNLPNSNIFMTPVLSTIQVIWDLNNNQFVFVLTTLSYRTLILIFFKRTMMDLI